MLSTKSLPTGQRYHAEFFIDLDDNGSLSSGDRTGIAIFNVMPNAEFCDAMFFAVDLGTEP